MGLIVTPQGEIGAACAGAFDVGSPRAGPHHCRHEVSVTDGIMAPLAVVVLILTLEYLKRSKIA